jgi:hypothetical protein
MNKLPQQSAVWFICYLFLAGCVEPYPPPISNSLVDFLVVDGYLDNTDGSATVALSRAIPLSSSSGSTPPERDAIVIVEDSDGNSFNLVESEPGIYKQPSLPVVLGKEYRVRIKTTDEQEYVSDFVSAKSVPPIDSVTWAVSEDGSGVEISVTAHDDSKQTRFYQWTFEETYQYQSAYMSYYEKVGEDVVVIPNGAPTYECWRTESSQNIIIGSSQNLAQDIIYKHPVTHLPRGTQKLADRYSIRVKQRSLSRNVYDYWFNLQQTTENLGGLYDPQPGQIIGNLANVDDPTNIVLGYFNVVSSTQKRIFIDFYDLPRELQIKPDAGCVTDTVLLERLPTFNTFIYSLITQVYQGPVMIGYLYSKKQCVDCRLQRGVTTKPEFWE